MQDLISRQAAIDAIANCTNCGDEKTLRAYVAKYNLDNEWSGGVLVAINAVKDLPSAQPEIIRCKDCRHGVDYYHEGDCYCSNPKWGLKYFGGSWEFYCADAERRTDD